ncbi:uncharacterized protein LOC112679660, partial [Sipha flava]|uniref:Uncharacterized protein LOC112679660 n=1 Tax=Sipha flava TaxID=143950 RepID=A0A8B8F3G6_9HEMI
MALLLDADEEEIDHAYQFNVLLLKIESNISKQNTHFRETIPPKQKLAVCLWFLGTGDSYQSIAFSFRSGHKTVQSIVLEVCSAIISKLKEECLLIPSEEDWKRIAKEFWDIWNFTNCIGALDGKHVVIEAPSNRAYGKNSDGGILSNSNLGKALERNKLNIPNDQYLPDANEKLPLVIIGNEAFPLKKYLLRPYPGLQMYEDQKKKNFNDRLSRA